MYKQLQPYGCGLFAVANALNLGDDFVTEERFAASKGNGNLTGMLDRWLQESGKPFYMQPIFYDTTATKLPKHHVEYKPSGEKVVALPMVLCVRLSDEGLWHMVGVNVYPNGTAMLYDSLKSEPIQSTLAEINEMYESVFGLFVFCSVETGDYAFIME